MFRYWRCNNNDNDNDMSAGGALVEGTPELDRVPVLELGCYESQCCPSSVGSTSTSAVGVYLTITIFGWPRY